jgi:hypothetical protein
MVLVLLFKNLPHTNTDSISKKDTRKEELINKVESSVTVVQYTDPDFPYEQWVISLFPLFIKILIF